MKNVAIAAFAGSLLIACGPAWAGPCADEIAKLEESAKATDAKNSPRSQEAPKDKNGQPSATSAGSDGGGAKSASAKILEAKAGDQRGDEPGCMQAVDEAKKLMGS